MRGIVVTCAAVAALVCAPAFAQKAKKTKGWAQEPDTVLGIKLGVPVASLALAECKSYSSTPPEGAQCVVKHEYGYRPDKVLNLIGMPDIGVHYATEIMVFDGFAKTLTLNLEHKDYPKIKDILIERYGKPQEQLKSDVTTGAGAVLSSESLMWKGKKMNLIVVERALSADKTAVFFTDLAVQAADLASRDKKSKDAASKF
ncbi:hypothetical protein F3J24_04610 [Comamonas sp. Tr-654]|uniref:hypothetical protein n=1 Tax=Comamonas sp. Tr-654 TaxID=2608341 RepID=UPI00141FE8CE|nr:hypothetical protein [Comamonas sp. Tr-654]NIF82789.1 hypothetical protein [Comamonas sp. Tr-654]